MEQLKVEIDQYLIIKCQVNFGQLSVTLNLRYDLITNVVKMLILRIWVQIECSKNIVLNECFYHLHQHNMQLAVLRIGIS